MSVTAMPFPQSGSGSAAPTRDDTDPDEGTGSSPDGEQGDVDVLERVNDEEPSPDPDELTPDEPAPDEAPPGDEQGGESSDEPEPDLGDADDPQPVPEADEPDPGDPVGTAGDDAAGTSPDEPGDTEQSEAAADEAAADDAAAADELGDPAGVKPEPDLGQGTETNTEPGDPADGEPGEPGDAESSPDTPDELAAAPAAGKKKRSRLTTGTTIRGVGKAMFLIGAFVAALGMVAITVFGAQTVSSLRDMVGDSTSVPGAAGRVWLGDGEDREVFAAPRRGMTSVPVCRVNGPEGSPVSVVPAPESVFAAPDGTFYLSGGTFSAEQGAGVYAVACPGARSALVAPPLAGTGVLSQMAGAGIGDTAVDGGMPLAIVGVLLWLVGTVRVHKEYEAEQEAAERAAWEAEHPPVPSPFGVPQGRVSAYEPRN